MHSDLIGKIEKARQYAQEPERIELIALQARFRGDNGDHLVTLRDGAWQIDSEPLGGIGASPHVMALQRLLEPMLPSTARQPASLAEGYLPSELISKINKARRYAEEPERVEILTLTARFRGTNDTHQITLQDNHWNCDCAFFRSWNTCQHVMAVQRVLEPMLPPEATQPPVEEMVQGVTAAL